MSNISGPGRLRPHASIKYIQFFCENCVYSRFVNDSDEKSKWTRRLDVSSFVTVKVEDWERAKKKKEGEGGVA